jgi:hypothetical protein
MAQFTTSSEGFAQSSWNLSNSKLFLNGKTCAPGPRCRGPVAQPGPWWTKGGTDRRRGSMLPSRGAPGAEGLRSSPVKVIEEEGNDAVLVRWHNDGEEWRRLEPGVRAEEGKRELESGGRRCRVAEGGGPIFIGADRSQGGGCRG